MTAAPTAADYDDMLHAFGRPKKGKEPYRNYYCCEAIGETAKRFEALGWWDFGRFINDGRDAVYHVNGAGRQALAAWEKQRSRNEG